MSLDVCAREATAWRTTPSPRRFYDTVRHLKPIQVVARLRLRVAPKRVDLGPPGKLRSHAGMWIPAIPRHNLRVGNNRFRFLNHEGMCAGREDWSDETQSRLWLYHLHYFDCLHDPAWADEEDKSLFVDRWIRENPPAQGVGWEPYPLSRRIVNWVKWHLPGRPLSGLQRHSLAVQMRFLRRRLEYHLLGNHLLANAKALVTGGLFFDGSEAEKWLEKGRRLWQSQIVEQVLADGGHYERSPMYHAAVLEDVLDLLNLCRTYEKEDTFRDSLAELARRMLVWKRCMIHPDGEIALFNDSAIGASPAFADLCHYAGRLGIPVQDQTREPASGRPVYLDQTGYVRLRAGDMLVILDVGEIGPEFQPGHAHADTFSFELSVGRQRVIVDSGTSSYEWSRERFRQRGTAAHNTVCVDDENSSEVWLSHRVARRAHVDQVQVRCVGGTQCVSAVHDGYRRLNGVGTHVRGWKSTDRCITIADRVDGHGSHLVGLSLLVHPDVAARQVSDREIVLTLPGGRAMDLSLDAQMTWRIEPGTWHPEFGKTIPCSSVCGQYHGSLPFTAENSIVLNR